MPDIRQGLLAMLLAGAAAVFSSALAGDLDEPLFFSGFEAGEGLSQAITLTGNGLIEQSARCMPRWL